MLPQTSSDIVSDLTFNMEFCFEFSLVVIMSRSPEFGISVTRVVWSC